MIGVHIELQHYNMWSSQFLLLMSRPEHAKQRIAFLNLRGYRQIRSGLTLIAAYLFAQATLLISHYEESFDNHQKALARFNSSRQTAVAELEKMKVAVKQLQTAPGLWHQHASNLDSQLMQLRNQFSNIKALPSLHKRERNNETRTAETWLLRTTVWLAGSDDKRRSSSLRTPSWNSSLIEYLCRWILGKRVDIGVQPVLEWVRLAEWASELTKHPRESAALRKIYDEDGELLSTLIDRHRKALGHSLFS